MNFHMRKENAMVKCNIFWFLLLLMVLGNLEAQESSCYYGTQEGVFSAYCMKLSLTKVPNNLKPNLGGLDLSWNFIDNLYNDTFEHYSTIKYLYLDRNPGMILDSHTFAPLTKLKTLDLSHNRLVNISNLYLPPSLEKLYLNGMITITDYLPISSLHSLIFLSLSGCSLDQIPSFGGSLPSLETLNLTSNSLKNFKVDSLAFVCQLKKLHISLNVSFRSDCECLRLKHWFEDHDIVGSNLVCDFSKKNHECDTLPSTSSKKIYEACKTEVMNRRFFQWLLVGCVVFIVIFSCIILYLCCNRKKMLYNMICCKKNVSEK